MTTMTRDLELKRIEKVNLEITTLALGTAALGGLYTSVSDEDAEQVVSTAIDNGINYFDTAPLYGHGIAEIRLGRALRASGKKFIISTKVGRVLKKVEDSDPSWLFADASTKIEPVFDWSAEGIKRSILESLERLGLDHIDIVHMHDADDHIEEAIHSAFPVLAELRSQGIIKAIGTGLNQCKHSIQIMSETDLDFALIAGRFTLLDQEAQEVLFPLAVKRNVSILVGGVFNSGILANPNPGVKFNYLPASNEIIEKAREIASFFNTRGIPLTAAAIQFPLRHPAVVSVLAGPRNRLEMSAIIKDFNLTIPDTVWQDLDASGLIAPISK
jgi:D-threo-aldose 1-dehydrogenase